MEKKNYLLVKTSRGIEKIQLYKSLDEIVGVEEEDLTITSSEEVSLSNLENNIFPFNYKIDENAFSKKITGFTYIPSIRMRIGIDRNTPPLYFTDNKKILPNIQAFFYFVRKKLLNEKINISAGEMLISLKLADKKFYFLNEEEVNTTAIGREARINYDQFFPLSLKEGEYEFIEDFYTKQYGKQWKEKLNSEISENVNDFIAVYYKNNNEPKNNVITKIRKNDVVITLKDSVFEFENVVVFPTELKLNLKQKVLKFGKESDKVLIIDKKYANKEILEKELPSILKEVEIKKDQKVGGYIIQSIDQTVYNFYKNKISGTPFLINDRYVLKTSGTKEKLFRSEYDELFFIERDLKDYKIITDYFKDNGGVILVCSGAGTKGSGKYGGEGGNGMMLRYEIPSNPSFKNIAVNFKFEAGGSNGASGETFGNLKGDRGGAGGKNVTAILKENSKEIKLVAYGGGGGGGSGYDKTQLYNNETLGGIGGRDGNNRKVYNEAYNVTGGRGTDANIYNDLEIYEKNVEEPKIIIGVYLD